MISVLIPLLNERESLEILYKRVIKSILEISKTYEIIFLDDGSIDGSLDVLKVLAKKDNNVKVFSFRKNRGKSEILTFGFQKAKGDYIITLDADLQDRPEEIKKMFKKSKEGFDLVCGWRKERHDSIPKIISSKLFNFIVGTLWGLHLHDYNCGLKIYSKDAAQSLVLYGGMHRFIPLLAFQKGFSVSEVPIEHDKRIFGKSKYGFSKLWKDLPDIFTMLFLSRYSTRPLHFFGTIGTLLFLIGLIILGYLSILHFQKQAIGTRPLLFFGGLFVLGGIQIILTGFLADLFINLHKKNNSVQNFLKYSNEK